MPGFDFKPRRKPESAADVAHAQEVAESLQQYLADEPGTAAPWRRLPEIPTALEIMTPQARIDPVLLEAQSWSDLGTYLQAKHTLLREDGCWPLRQSVAELRERPQMLEVNSFTQAKVYDSVFFVGATFSHKGLSFKVEFSTRRVQKNINWPQSKRLKTGTIVALSPARDAFKRICVVASVVARPLKDLKVEQPKKPSVSLRLGNIEDANLDPQLEWVMVEASSGYWEAYQHTLKALQKMPGERFPLAKYICGGITAACAPEYSAGIFDLKAALGSTTQPPCTNAAVDMAPAAAEAEAAVVATIPPIKPAPSLDDSQEEALRRILTKDLAIVQGPPGTGKTTLTVTAMRVLLSSKSCPRGPIIVVAQTNHALDQLLDLIRDFEPGFVRLGNQTELEDISRRTISKLRQTRTKQVSALRDTIHETRKRLGSQLKDIASVVSTTSPMTHHQFYKCGLISEQLWLSFGHLRNDWVGDGISGSASPIETWCGPQLQRFSDWQKQMQAQAWTDDEDEDDEDRADELDLEVDTEDDPWENLNGLDVDLDAGYIAGRGLCLQEADASKILSTYDDANKIPEHARVGLYNYLQHKAKGIMSKRLREFDRSCVEYARNCRANRMQTDCELLGSTRVIGVTLTGLSKYRGLLMSLNPKIVFVEEAAQTLEPLVSVASLPSVQHLVLVGDHMQLRGQVNCTGLENAPFHLNCSLFERLVNQGIERSRLKHQRRMRPEIRRLLNPIYPELVDHPCVENRPDVKGVQHNVFFAEHSSAEDLDEMKSRFNDGEARQITFFAKYLLENGYDADKISILTFYAAQKRLIIKHAKSSSATSMLRTQIHTVDSFQGEENDIIILSLVRNNIHGSIGFLNDVNRVNVALSRARDGLFIFGCREGLARNYLWLQALYILRDEGLLLNGVPLMCTNHGTKMLIGPASELGQLDGGCLQRCEETLACGHICNLHCHPYPHSAAPCRQPCLQKLSCKHTCRHECWYEKHQCAACPQPTLDAAHGPTVFTNSLAGTDSKPRSIVRRISQRKSADTVDLRLRSLPQTTCGAAYRAYANGGAYEDDMRLAKEASQNSQRQLDELARKHIAEMSLEKVSAALEKVDLLTGPSPPPSPMVSGSDSASPEAVSPGSGRIESASSTTHDGDDSLTTSTPSDSHVPTSTTGLGSNYSLIASGLQAGLSEAASGGPRVYTVVKSAAAMQSNGTKLAPTGRLLDSSGAKEQSPAGGRKIWVDKYVSQAVEQRAKEMLAAGAGNSQGTKFQESMSPENLIDL